MVVKCTLADALHTIFARSSILLIMLLTVTTLAKIGESSTDLTATSTNHKDVAKIRTIRSNDQNLSHSIWVDVENDHYQMSFIDCLKYVLIDVIETIGIYVNYLLQKPGYTITDFSEMMSNPDLTMTTDQLLTKYGYISKSHNVVTDDGYVLKMFQIVGRTTEPIQNGKPAVLLCHGMSSSSDDFLLSGPEQSLGYLLSDAGYDVWLFNQRGNFYSRANIYMSPDEQEFWNFSWHEIGVYDLPAVIDYIIDVTGQEQITFIGYSQGATAFFVMLSEKPEYNEKIKLTIMYAAVAYMRHTRSASIKTAAYIAPTIYNIYTMFHTAEIVGRDSFETKIARKLFLSKSFLQVLIYGVIIYMSTGYDGTEINKPLLPMFLYHSPAGISLKQGVHYGQSIVTHTFRQYDYSSSTENEKIYGQPEPPSYNLNNTKVPVILFYGKQDAIANVEDMFELSQMLPNVPLLYEIPFDNINHMDFAWGRDAKELIYSKTIELLNNATKINNP